MTIVVGFGVNTIKHLASERSKLYTDAFFMLAPLVMRAMTIAAVSMLINSDKHDINKFITDSSDTH